ncbi:hypothetical protein MLD38_006410 [Melastoma candidum]|uniref:Uncharacterized protein n=1 Tax=Melastoma candidum TaxID=119954 RepID=A0ACB9RM30_9MYRT|nr:hypothetical protein MLD38_006410 [Melastoma candidum]
MVARPEASNISNSPWSSPLYMASSGLSVPIGTCALNIIIAVALVIGSTNEAIAEGSGFSSRRRTIEVASMMEAATASSCSSTGYGNGMSMLEVVHRNGPCSKDPRPVDHSEMMTRDSLRLKWLGMKSGVRVKGWDTRESKLAKSILTVPTKLWYEIGMAAYMVTVELGTPARKLQLDLDTGRGLTATQCKGFTKSYNQMDPVFDPSKSTTYSAATCSSPACSRVFSMQIDLSHRSGCSKSHQACTYSITYGNNTTTEGLISTDTLALALGDKITDFVFECALNVEGLYGSDCLLGLSNDNTSIISQTASMFGRYFSYCLLSSLNSTGFLTFGQGTTRRKPANSTSLGFTPLIIPHVVPHLYGITITGITVGATPLSKKSSSILSKATSIIDSGTVITRLPPTVYMEVCSVYKKYMAKYPKVPPAEFLDTCHDFSKFNRVRFPEKDFAFRGGMKVELDVMGIFYTFKRSQVCLAFAPNSKDSDLVVFGNMQLRTLEVTHDVAGGKLGFSSNGCP